MTDNAAAPAPVTEEVTLSETVETPEPTEDDILDEVWESANTPDEEITDEPVVQEEPKAEDAPKEPETPRDAPVEAPSDLPASLRGEWAGMSETAREAVQTFYRDQNNKLAEQGRKVQAIDPIYQRILEAQKSIPGLGAKTPDQIGQELFGLAQFQANFEADPVKQTLTFLQNAGLTDTIRAALGGADQGTTQLLQEISQLKTQLSDALSPDAARRNYEQFSAEDRVHADIAAFQQNAEHWDAVEPILPTFVQAAQVALGEGASAKDTLEAAYNMAIQAKGLPAKAKDAPPASPQPDPAKAEKVQKATSVNLSSQPTGNPRNLSEDEVLDAVYARMTAS